MKGKLLPGVLVGLFLLSAGCEKKGGPYSVLDAVIVPGADVTILVDYDSIRESPSFRAALQNGNDTAPEAGGLNSQREEQLAEATGLTRESLLALSFSGDLDELDPDIATGAGDFNSLRAATGLLFDSVITEDQVEAGLTIIVSDQNGASVSSRLIEGRRTFTVARDAEEGDTLYVALAKGGRAVFVAPNSDSIIEIFKREELKKKSELPPALEALQGEMGDDMQFRSAFAMPEALRATLDGKITALEKEGAGNPGVGMVMGLVAPFKGLAGLTIGARFTEKIDLFLTADLGGESDAIQAAALLQTMVLPVLGARLFQEGGIPAAGGEKLTAVSEGSRLIVRATLETADLSSLPL